MLDMLKKNGYHTSANKVGAGGKMLTGEITYLRDDLLFASYLPPLIFLPPLHSFRREGDQQYTNPVWSVGSAPRQLDPNPSVDNLFEVLKRLNGVGDVRNSVMSETWSSKFAASVFENEQLQSIAEFPGTNNENYSGGKGLSSQFKAIGEFMKSRTYRKVNREVFIVKQNGSYDGHGGNLIGE